MADEFIAAKPSPWAMALARAALPLALWSLGVVGVDYDADDLTRLRALDLDTVLLTPNHPTDLEPALLFHLSRVVRQPFYFLACRESFDHFRGLWGAFTRRIGAYSVVRGAVDRASYRATRDLLAQPGSKLVVFPEGEVYSQNDTLLPFHNGVFQMAYWALEDRRKAGKEGEPLYVLPIAIKYRFVRDMTAEIQASLTRLEHFTGAAPPPDAHDYQRLRGIGEAMLLSCEREYRLTSPKDAAPDADLTPRLNAIKEAILQRVASAAGVALPKGETLPERMRALIHVIETVTREEPQEKTPYDNELRRQQSQRAEPLLRDLRRLANWIAVYDGYVKAAPTQERMADTLTRLERECFGKEKLHGPRRCLVRLGVPIDVNQRGDAYAADRRVEVARLTRDTEAQVSALLSTLTPQSESPLQSHQA